jgi:nitroimidazol reductase NimA-like FMN-containing flavoprotein (pyridoxamine 5'-phosphate oxidase superfamily)
MTTGFPPSARTRLRRRPQRGHYDEATIFAVLDAGLIAHVGYVADGQPLVTPTAYWREGRRLLWHGSAGSRALRAQAAGIPVCVTVSHLDGLVLGRSGFAHSVLYRSVMAFGRTAPIEEREAKRRAMHAFIDRLYPGRTRELRPIHDVELDMIAVISMEIEEASAKIRDGGVNEKEEDLQAPGWAGVIPVRTSIGAKQTDARIDSRVPFPPSVAGYAESARLDEVLGKTPAS